jgi:hypothetical protein
MGRHRTDMCSGSVATSVTLRRGAFASQMVMPCGCSWLDSPRGPDGKRLHEEVKKEADKGAA